MNHRIATLEIYDAEQLHGVQNMFKLLDVLMDVYFPIFFTIKKLNGTFLGGPVTESLPARALRFDPWPSKISHAMGQGRLCATTTEPVL